MRFAMEFEFQIELIQVLSALILRGARPAKME